MALRVEIDVKKWRGKVLNYRHKVHSRVEDEIKAAAFEADREAKRGAPVDTGRLQASIHPEFSGTTGYQYNDDVGNSFDGKFQEKAEPFQAIVGSNVEYAKDVEDRTPFLEPAVRLAAINLRRRLSKVFTG